MHKGVAKRKGCQTKYRRVNKKQKFADSEKAPQNEMSTVNENQEETIRKNRAKMKEIGITTSPCSPKKLTARLLHMTSQRRSHSTTCSKAPSISDASRTAPTHRSLRMMESEHMATMADEMNDRTDDGEEDCYEGNNATEDCDGQSTSKRGRGLVVLPQEWGTAGYKLEVFFNLVLQPEGEKNLEGKSGERIINSERPN